MSSNKKFKMPSALTILFCIVVFVAVLTWFIPAGQYDLKTILRPDGTLEQVPLPGTYHSVISNKQGLSNIFYSPIKGFVSSIDIGIYLMIMSGFIALVMKTGAISAGISHLTKKLSGKEILLIPLLMFLFSLCSTILGFWEETLGFYILVVPVFVAAGYDAIVGLFVVIWGAGLGLIGSTINPFATGIASELANVPIGTGMFLRFVIYILFFTIGTIYIMRYAKKIKNDPSASLVYHLKKTHEEHFLDNIDNTCNRITHIQKRILFVFACLFLILIIGVLPWKEFNIYLFDDIKIWILSVPILGDILGPFPAAQWKIPHLSLLFLVASILVGFLGKFTEDDFISTFFSGVADIMSVVFVIAIANGVKIIMDDGLITHTILSYGERILSNFSGSVFSCASFLFYLPLSFLIPSSTGLAALSIPLLAPLANIVGVGREIVVTAYQTANGLINLIAPTSAVLMGALTITKIPYSVYIKSILKLLIIIVVILLLILSLIG